MRSLPGSAVEIVVARRAEQVGRQMIVVCFVSLRRAAGTGVATTIRTPTSLRFERPNVHGNTGTGGPLSDTKQTTII